MGRKIRLTEAGLRRVIANSVKRVMNEWTANYPESKNVEDRRNEKLGPIRLEILNICCRIQPKLRYLAKTKQLGKFLDGLHKKTHLNMPTNIIWRLASRIEKMPRSGDPHKDYAFLMNTLLSDRSHYGSVSAGGMNMPQDPFIWGDGIAEWLLDIDNELQRTGVGTGHGGGGTW